MTDSDLQSTESYVDDKGRTRWRCNDAVAKKLQQLHDYLVIGNYDASPAADYPRLALTISRHPESLLVMHEEGRLAELLGVSTTASMVIGQFLRSGTGQKMNRLGKNFLPVPKSVLELTEIPQLGAKTAKSLFQDHGIDGLVALKKSLDAGELQAIRGIGPAMIEAIQKHLEEHKAE